MTSSWFFLSTLKKSYHNTKHKSVVMSVNVSAMICFKFKKKQLKFRNNKSYYSVIANFHTACAKQYSDLNLKFENNKSYHQKRAARRYIVTSPLLKPLYRRLSDVTSFELSKSLYYRSVLFERTINFGCAFLIFRKFLDRRISETKFPTDGSFFVSNP